MTTYEQKHRYFEELYEKYRQTVYRYVLVSVEFNENMANDCMQDIFTVAYSRVDELMEHPNPGGFLIVTARNIVRKSIERQANTQKRILPIDERMESIAYEQDFERFLDDCTDVDTLKREFLEMLTQEELTLYMMFYEYRDTVARIAEELNMSQSNVKIRLYRLRLKVKKLIRKRFEDC